MHNYALQPQHERLLQAACEAFDRARQAWAQIDADGLTTVDRHGQPRVHPLAALERDSRLQAIRAIQALGLDDSP